jgi:DNA-directed RNA polymerase subunit M/transcription elongation factor TFIIS
MELGYIIDHTQHGSSVVQTWFAGKPEKSFWTGLQTEKRDHRQVVTFRCTRCGYLESYAA